MGCRDMFESRSNNSVVWNSSYCDDGGGSCSAGWSSSCGGGGGGGDSGRSHRQRGGGPWKMVVAGQVQRLRSECRYVGWSHTN